jgi:FolB domain-containing protein
MDKIVIRDLLVRGIIGINEEERKNRQDVLVNIAMHTDTRLAAASDNIEDSVNYRSIAKAVIAHIEEGQPMLVERLAQEISNICFSVAPDVQAVDVTVEKPGAVRFARSVGVVIHRTRDESLSAGRGQA